MKYKICFNPCLTALHQKFFEKEHGTHWEAKEALNLIAEYTIFLHDSRFMSDFSNIAFIEELNDFGQWEEYDEDNIKV